MCTQVPTLGTVVGVGVDVGLVLDELTTELDELLVETGTLEDDELQKFISMALPRIQDNRSIGFKYQTISETLSDPRSKDNEIFAILLTCCLWSKLERWMTKTT
jgi:hypothetical protein